MGQTRTQAAKRRLGDLETQHETLKELFQLLIASPERYSLAALRRLRSGEDDALVLRDLKADRSQPQSAYCSEHDTHSPYVVTLLQSTASLEKFVTCVDGWEMEEDGVRQANIADLRHLRNLVVDARTVRQNVTQPRSRKQSFTTTSPQRSAERSGATNLPALPESPDVPLNIVPARPWTTLTNDEVLVSRLIMVFMNYQNAYSRYVEEDLFMHAMKFERVGCEYCSPFLVNAICAIACMNVEYDGTFDGTLAEPDDWMTRGEHFHDEAMRLWLLEAGRASLTSLQALVLMALESSFRGRDKLGSVLLAAAVQMNKDLPWSDVSSTGSIGAAKRDRARTCLAWTTHFVDVAFQQNLLKASAPIDPRLPFIPNLPDESRTWHGRPYKHLGISYRANTLFRERCILTRLSSEVNGLLFGGQGPTSQVKFQESAKSLGARLEDWHENLPSDLRYHERLPVPVLELYAQYQCIMQLLCTALSGFGPPELIEAGHANESSAEMQGISRTASVAAEQSLEFAGQSATLLKGYRETFGLRVTLPFIFQAAALTSLILLRRLAQDAVANNSKAPLVGSTTRTVMQSCFEESFRCVLGSATQVILARGIARMLGHTARNMAAPLSPLAVQAIGSSEQSTWRLSDLDTISSAYPNYAIADHAHSVREIEMEELLKRWEVAAM